MQPTRQTWTAAGLAVLLAVFTPIVASPVPAIGAAIVFGWVVAQQLVAVRQFQTTAEATTITVEPSAITVQVDTAVPTTLSVERPKAAAKTELTVTLSLPPAAKPVDTADRQVTLTAGQTQATTTVSLEIPTAGRMQFPAPTWELTDVHDAYTESFDRGPTPTVTVEAETIRNIHVGRGGSELTAFGQHLTDGTGDGLTPAELRQYLPGDSADKIDWKATARLSETYVREYEAESDREITLLFDHRSQMAGSTAATSPLAYLREVALGLVSTAESTGDPLGLISVGDEGLTTTIPATRQQIGYSRIREHLLEVEPTPAGPPASSVDLHHPEAARRLAKRLADDTSAFGTTLRMFAESTPAYVERIEADPLYGAVEYPQAASNGTQLTIILTADTNRPQLRETVRAAAGNDSAVLVFLTPQVLFDTTGLGGLETAYSRYHEFEQFRTDLERFSSVVAYEVGPGDRLATLLSTQRSKTSRATR